MSEHNLYDAVMPKLKKLDPHRIENSAGIGTPDIETIYGWIECKWLPKWPINKSGIVGCPAFSKQQRAWLRRRREEGGSAFLLIQIGRDYLLFDGSWAATNFGFVTREELEFNALGIWRNSIDGDELVELLRREHSLCEKLGKRNVPSASMISERAKSDSNTTPNLSEPPSTQYPKTV